LAKSSNEWFGCMSSPSVAVMTSVLSDTVYGANGADISALFQNATSRNAAFCTG